MNIRPICAAVVLTALAPVCAQAALYTEVEGASANTNWLDKTSQSLGALSTAESTIVSGYLGLAQSTGSTALIPSPDSYSFSVAAGTTVTALLTVTSYAGDLGNVNPTLRFYNTATGLTNNVASVSDTNSTVTTPLTLGYTFNNAGTYRVGVIGGNASGATGGDVTDSVAGWNYNLQLTSVSAVPEPESMAMLLAGLAAVGVVARRRKTRNA